jgi:glyoxylase-like metal-dependent hydrolase (beta-lactamase superfamily II)
MGKEVIMSAIRQSGKVNENTTLIDIGISDVNGITAVYLVEGIRKCLIDGGTRNDAPSMVKMLSKLGAFPPDLIIVTHPHWDHSQGITFMRQEASRLGKVIEVLASSEALPLLADVSFNDAFGSDPYEGIQDVT